MRYLQLAILLLLIAPFVQGVTQFTECENMDVMRNGPDISIVSRKASYDAGDTARFLVQVNNTMAIPLADGKIYVDIIRDSDGPERIFDTLELSSLQLKPGQSDTLPLSWDVPDHLPAGEYIAKAYVVVGEKTTLPASVSREPYCYTGNKFISPSPDTSDFTLTNDAARPVTVQSVTVNDKPILGGSTVLINDSTITFSLTMQGSGTATVSATTNTGSRSVLDRTVSVSGTHTITKQFTYNGTSGIDVQVTDSHGLRRDLTIPLSWQTSDPKIRYFGLEHVPNGEPNTVYLCTYLNLLGGDIHSNFTAAISYNGNTIERFTDAVFTERGFAVNTSSLSEDGVLSVRLVNENGTVFDAANITYQRSAFATGNIGLSLSLDKEQVQQGSTIPYTISVSSTDGDSLEKPVIVTVRDSSETLVKAQQVAVTGSEQETLRASYAPGTYTVKAKEAVSDTATQQTFNIVSQSSNTGDSAQETNRSSNAIWWWAAGIAAAVLVGIIVVGSMQKQR